MKLNKLLCAAALFLFPLLLHAQGQVSTRSHRIADFTDKVTQVVLTGNALVSNALRQEVVAGWTASAFEFCTLEQFEKLKTQEDYYFLMVLESQFKGEERPGVSFLTLLKGGPEAQKGIGAMFEVVALPLMAALGSTGRELTYLSGLLKTVQEYTLEAMESEKVAYNMEHWVNGIYSKWGSLKQVLMADEDLAPTVTEKDLSKRLSEHFQVVDTSVADQAYLDASYNTLTSYVVAPIFPEKGSYCYKMLFEADTHSLIYLTKHKIDAKKGVGFLPEDIRKIAR
ncbi:MAG: hypothetical protein IK074_02855 [Bacteroidales bacterium]|nr:hypothetical protein [Bacteroidales bacterium]